MLDEEAGEAQRYTPSFPNKDEILASLIVDKEAQREHEDEIEEQLVDKAVTLPGMRQEELLTADVALQTRANPHAHGAPSQQPQSKVMEGDSGANSKDVHLFVLTRHQRAQEAEKQLKEIDGHMQPTRDQEEAQAPDALANAEDEDTEPQSMERQPPRKDVGVGNATRSPAIGILTGSEHASEHGVEREPATGTRSATTSASEQGDLDELVSNIE